VKLKKTKEKIMNYQKSTCPKCSHPVEIPEMTFCPDPEYRGWWNYWVCGNCGVTTVIDETSNQFTGESHKDDPKYNFIETCWGRKRFPLDHEF